MSNPEHEPGSHEERRPRSYIASTDAAPPIYKDADAPEKQSGLRHRIYRMGLVVMIALVATGLATGTANAMAKKDEDQSKEHRQFCHVVSDEDYDVGFLCSFSGQG